MLKKGLRLRKKEDFDRVFRSGKPLFFNEIGCRYLEGGSSLRLGFSFSKKHLPLAVDRNRLRRGLFSAQGGVARAWRYHIFYRQKAEKDRHDDGQSHHQKPF